MRRSKIPRCTEALAPIIEAMEKSLAHPREPCAACGHEGRCATSTDDCLCRVCGRCASRFMEKHRCGVCHTRFLVQE